MDTHYCPFCKIGFALTEDTYVCYSPCFETSDALSSATKYHPEMIDVHFFRCPSCKKHSITVEGIGRDVPKGVIPILPRSLAQQFPDYIPEQIRNDYEEAYAIVNLSPKASATLSRRCLQSMIRDYWVMGKGDLNKHIELLEEKVSPEILGALNALRIIGNVGAHMTVIANKIVDIEPGEAEKLLKLIEHLFRDWYIAREEKRALYEDIVGIAAEKKEARKAKE